MTGGTTRAKRTTALIIALAMLLLALVSVLFLAAEADHSCAGDDCAVCACIRQCVETLQQLGSLAALAAMLLPVLLFVFPAARIAAALRAKTPVSFRVRMNN